MSKVAVVVASLVALGCAPQTIIESRRAPDMTEKLTELFVISGAGSDGELKAPEFEKALTETGRTCGLRIGVSSLSKLELDTSVHEERMKTFGGHHLLTVELTRATTVQNDFDVVMYDARLYQMEPKKMLWRADMRMKVGGTSIGSAGETLALDMLRQMHSDGLVKWCEMLVQPEKPVRHRADGN